MVSSCVFLFIMGLIPINSISADVRGKRTSVCVLSIADLEDTKIQDGETAYQPVFLGKSELGDYDYYVPTILNGKSVIVLANQDEIHIGCPKFRLSVSLIATSHVCIPRDVVVSGGEGDKMRYCKEEPRVLNRKRMKRTNSDVATCGHKRRGTLTDNGYEVSLCDDYSVPVDFVNTKRPLSLGSAPFVWDKSSPHSENVQVLELYCDPRDSKAYLEPGEEVTKLYTTPDKEYSHPYSTDCSSPCEDGDEEDGYEDVGGEGGLGGGRGRPYYYADLASEASSEDRMSPSILDQMSRRQLYETAFDSKVSRRAEEDVDQVVRQSILVAERDIVEIEERMGGLELRPPSPPATAPLPAKFHAPLCISAVQSAPDLPVRAKDLRLPVKSIKHRLIRPIPIPHAEFEEKTKKGLEILEIKGRPRRFKYSSTESMATSSSGGSLESIRSSTSEGNRSTSSCESRRSSSLSSHSSDSGTGYPSINCLTARVFQQNKLNILSPISDKSSQEPCSETSENNKNNNSERASPEEVLSPVSQESQKKRRTPQNRNLCFDVEAHQTGSDSGISTELTELPFDMPKLRRRRLQEPPPDTSGSATSVDLRDLPFDMPKLRRRLRPTPSLNSQASSSSGFQDSCPTECRVPPPEPGPRRPALSLDLQELPRPQPLQPAGGCRRLSLEFPPPPPIPPPAGPPIDTTVPLERQGWYHGAITRLEAESILRMNREGSFLVRNSESTKLDYSLSLKSARGFMHMRIQKCKESGKYILGQFSNPFCSIPEMIKHYSVNRLPIRGAEHMCLLHPVIEQLL